MESEHPFPPSLLAKQVPHARLGSVEMTPLTPAGSSGSIQVWQGQWIPGFRPLSLSSGGGHIKEVIVASEAEPGDSEVAEGPGSPSRRGPGLSAEGEQAQVKLLVNKDGRYVCMLCHKTFKTVRPRAWGRRWGAGPPAPPSLGGAEPRRPSLTGQHPQGPHGHAQQPQRPRVQTVRGLLPHQRLAHPAPPEAHR